MRASELLPEDAASFVADPVASFVKPDFEDGVQKFLDGADAVISSLDLEEPGKGWTRWANDAFLNGAGKAHRFSKIRASQEVADFSEAGRDCAGAD